VKELPCSLVVFGLLGAHAYVVHRVAKAESLSVTKWTLFGFLFPGPGLIAVLLLPPVRRTCPVCGSKYRPEIENCEKCGRPLPSPYAGSWTVSGTPDAQCPSCHAPFNYSDYREDAHRLHVPTAVRSYRNPRRATYRGASNQQLQRRWRP